MSALAPLASEHRPHFGWMAAPHLKAVIAALEAAEPGAARYVGGCVRDSLLGAAPKDFDIATMLEPAAVITALEAAGLRSVPTGIDHGTVTAVADHQGVEITTLRADVSTDGRRATVAFTRDWATDAGRRDFTINALYLTPDMRLFDPVGGLADIAARRVAFIGDAETRIREDYLRILRFFRFSARFCDRFDEGGLAACAALKDGVDRLSAERVGAEFMAILSLPRAGFALRAMQAAGVLQTIWDAPANIDALERLKLTAPLASPAVALAVLFGEGGEGVGSRLRLSNAEKAIRADAIKGGAAIAPAASGPDLRRLVYRLGKDGVTDAAATAAAFGRIDGAELARLMGLVEGWTPPSFPLSGKHVVEAGVAPGPAVATILAAAERRWIEEDFPPPARARRILADEIARNG